MIQHASQQIEASRTAFETPTCNLCGSENRTSLGDCSLPIELRGSGTTPDLQLPINSFHQCELMECRDCGSCYRFPQPSRMILDEVYRQLSENAWNYRPDEITSWRLARKLLLRQAQTQTQIRIVDVGAFSGQFLSMLPQQWTKAAVEPCLSVRQSLAERRIEWLADFVENVPPDQFEQFDVVTLFDVFEHLPSPSETLRDAVRLLRPGGKLLLSTGNSGHWSWRLLGGQHWYLHTLQHLCFASQRSLRWIAKTQGLRIMSLIRHSHKRRCLREKVRHCVETVHWSARRHQGWKQSVAGLIQRLPSQHGLVHRDRAPMAISLKDHLLVCFEKPVV